MGQQPNIELEISDLPRPELEPAPARRWSPQRPGEITAPEEMPWGGAFGTTGPDAGYALSLLSSLDLPGVSDQERQNAEIGLAVLATARASHYGRAPTAEDIDVALLLLGYDDELPQQVIEALRARRSKWLAGLAHDPNKARRLVAAVRPKSLEAAPDTLRAGLIEGETAIEL